MVALKYFVRVRKRDDESTNRETGNLVGVNVTGNRKILEKNYDSIKLAFYR